MAPGLADGRLVQSGCLSDQRLPLELLRDRRCERTPEPGDDRLFPRHLPGDDMVDLQDRLSPQELTAHRPRRLTPLRSSTSGIPSPRSTLRPKRHPHTPRTPPPP